MNFINYNQHRRYNGSSKSWVRVPVTALKSGNFSSLLSHHPLTSHCPHSTKAAAITVDAVIINQNLIEKLNAIATMPSTDNNSATGVTSALFGSDGDEGFAEGFRDKVAALHSYFDRDKDGYLNHSELRGLQLLTSGEEMNAATYLMACKYKKFIKCAK